MILDSLPAMLMCTFSEACGEHRTCVTRGTAASKGIELHIKQNGVDQHGQNTVSKRSLDCMTTGDTFSPVHMSIKMLAESMKKLFARHHAGRMRIQSSVI